MQVNIEKHKATRLHLFIQQRKHDMNIKFTSLKSVALATIIASNAFAGMAYAGPASAVKLLTAHYEIRDVVKIEAGDFHFVPGQDAPVHTHEAPAIGYVAKGSIIYQVEGEKVQILHTGDAFYEPVGPNIVQFDNASATEVAIFIDFNLQQTGEPFIVFPEPLTEDIDRRTLPTIEMGEITTDKADIYATDLASGAQFDLINDAPTFGIVAEGVVEIVIEGRSPERVIAGASFALPRAAAKATFVNTSSEVSAKVITFVLR
jgi:quercetin dioxygenase-like cupin family protein